jgi:hypothetical protein
MVFLPLPRAMRHSIFSRRAAAAAVLVAAVLAVGGRPALADDRASIDEGRSAARGVLMMRDPRGCGIVVLRERCIADAEAFLRLHGTSDSDYAKIEKIGPHPASGLRAFVADGDRDGFDFALAWFNNAQANEQRWKANGRDAALYDAGCIDVLMPAASGQVAEFLASGSVIDLARHAALIPAGALPVDVAPLRAMSSEASAHANVFRMPQMVPFGKSLAAAVAASAPLPPLAPVPHADTPVADGALGVAFATMAELIDSPQWAAQDDAQAFATAVADRLDALVPQASRGEVATFRTAVRNGTFDHNAAMTAFTNATAAFIKAVPQERAQRVAFASAATQMGYNAAILRSSTTAAGLLRAVGGSAPLDAAVPGWSAARAGASAVGADDWAAQHAYSLRLVDLIRKANPS